VDIFLTTDAQAKPALRARLLNKALYYQDKINVTVANPLTWFGNQ
jgi:hypothetical protein